MEHAEQYTTQFSPKQIFDLVADVEKYPKFLPWCKSAKIIRKTKAYTLAELSIYFAPFSYKYISKVKFTPPKTDYSSCGLQVELVEGPFDKLNNIWSFERNNNATIVNFV